MKPSELFGVGVRLIGLLLILAAVFQLFAGAVDLLLGGPGGLIAVAVFVGLPALLIGVAMVRLADEITRFAYPDRR
jgi:hypothetical protein